MKTTNKRHEPIPLKFSVQPLGDAEHPKGRTTCGHCGLSWDDNQSTSWTPAPSGRCPFEYYHIYAEERNIITPQQAPKSPKPVSSLVFFIEAHCGCAVERYDGPASKTITVSCETLGGQREVETIPANLQAVKDWLGY